MESKIAKFLLSILNSVNSCSNFPSFFIVMTHNSPVSFRLIHFLLWIKGPNKSPNFRLSNVLWWKFAKFLMSFLKAQVSFFSNFASIPSNITSLYFFSLNILSFGQNQLIIKCKFFRFSNALMKICQIPHVIFQTTSQFFFKFYITLQYHER